MTIEIPRVSARPATRPRRPVTAIMTPSILRRWAVQTEQLILESRGVAVLTRHQVRTVLARLDRTTDTRPTPPTTGGAAAVAESKVDTTKRAHQYGECLAADPDGRRLWCRACAAAYLGLTSKTLANWAYEASPGPIVRDRKDVPRYQKADLDRWADAA